MYRRRSVAVLALLALAAPATAEWFLTAVPESSTSIAVNPATNRIYLRGSSGYATVVDCATYTRTSIPLGGTANMAIAVNPVLNKAYVPGAPYHTVIDGATNDTALVPSAGGRPVAVAVNPVTGKVYIANVDGDAVTVIDGLTNDTLSVPAGDNPAAVAVNPVTNKVYVPNYSDNTVTVIDGATNDTTLVPCGSHPSAVAANPATDKVYVSNSFSQNLTVIDGATNDTTLVPLGAEPGAVAVNPVTNRVYTVLERANMVAVIDGGADTVIARVPVGSGSTNLAVNPLANKVYVTAFGGFAMTVIDGATNQPTSIELDYMCWDVAVNPVTGQVFAKLYYEIRVFSSTRYDQGRTVHSGTRPAVVNPVTGRVYMPDPANNLLLIFDALTGDTAQVPTGDRPWAADVDPARNRIWVANSGSGNVTRVDGATNDTALIPAGVGLCAVAVNVVSNRVYVADSARNRVTVIDGATLDTLSVPCGANPCAVAVNHTTHKVYVANRAGSVTVIDGLTNDTALVPVGDSAFKVVLNRVTNKTYVATRVGVSVIDGATLDTALVACSAVWDICVSPLTNRIYAGRGAPAYNLLEIDGVTHDTVAIGERAQMFAVAYNPVTNKVYTKGYGSTGIYVVDCATRGWTESTHFVGTRGYLVVNPALNLTYLVNGTVNRLLEFREGPWNDSRVRVAMDPVPGCTTSLARPLLTGWAANRLSPHATGIMGVLNRAGDLQGAWNRAQIPSFPDSVTWSWTWGSDSLVMGENYVCCLPLENQGGTTNNLGQGTPFAGNIEVYPIYRMPVYTGVRNQVLTGGLAFRITPSVVARGRAKLQYALSSPDPARLRIFDVTGRSVWSLMLPSPAPVAGINLDLGRLSCGVYLAGLEAGKQGRTCKLIVAD